MLAATRGVDVEWVWPPNPDASAADVLLADGPIPIDVGRFHEIWRYSRPHGGVPLVLFTRGS